jgi:predicted CXXCH cytochrome family protein
LTKLFWPERLLCVPGVSIGILVFSWSIIAGKCADSQEVRNKQLFAQYGGSESCRDCHADTFRQWQQSNHGLAERPVLPALDETAFNPARSLKAGTQDSSVNWSNGTAFVSSVGLSHHQEIHRVARVIGNNPLRQLLVAFPDGRFQTLEASYDPRSNQWFNVNGEEDRQPGEWGHWTGRGANWNFMCASCHNTRLQKNYDEATDSYHTSMAEMSVGCEACHGPLKAHNEWQKKYGGTGAKDPTLGKLNHGQIMENCGECHSRRAELTGDFIPGSDYLNSFDPDMVDDTELYYADGQIHEEDYEFSSFLGSRMHDAGVYCLNCHEPHTAKIRLPGNWICMQCHGGGNPKAPVIDPVAHSHHKVRGYGADGKLMDGDLANYNAKDFAETGGECINCHMPQTPYMQRHWRHDHGFTIPDPLLTRELGIPNACNRCHQDKSASWALEATQKWYGTNMNRLLDTRRERTRAIAHARDGDPAAVAPLLKSLAGEPSPYWRAAIINQLGSWQDYSNVQAALLNGLGDTNALVRVKTAHVLDATEHPVDNALVLALRSRLSDPVRSVRITSAWSLRGELDTNSQAGKDLIFFMSENADEPSGQMQLGEFWAGRNDLTNALAYFQRGVAWDPNSAPFHRELALAWHLMGRNSEAIAQYKEAVRLAANDAEYYFELALVLNEAGDREGAISEFREAVRLDPHFSRAWYNLGLALAEANDTAGALMALQSAQASDPANPEISAAIAKLTSQRQRMIGK